MGLVNGQYPPNLWPQWPNLWPQRPNLWPITFLSLINKGLQLYELRELIEQEGVADFLNKICSEKGGVKPDFA